MATPTPSITGSPDVQLLDIGSQDAIKCLDTVQRLYLDTNYSGQWRPVEVYRMNKNMELRQAYNARKQLMSSGANEIFAFACAGKDKVIAIAKEGVLVRQSRNALGDTRHGLNLCRFPDVQLKAAAECQFSNVYLLVFKIAIDKVRRVEAKENNSMPPDPEYDCHVSKLLPSLEDSIGDQLRKSQIYLYEFSGPNATVERPRQVLPIVVIHYTRQIFDKNQAAIPPQPSSSLLSNEYHSIHSSSQASTGIRQLEPRAMPPPRPVAAQASQPRPPVTYPTLQKQQLRRLAPNVTQPSAPTRPNHSPHNLILIPNSEPMTTQTSPLQASPWQQRVPQAVSNQSIGPLQTWPSSIQQSPTRPPSTQTRAFIVPATGNNLQISLPRPQTGSTRYTLIPIAASAASALLHQGTSLTVQSAVQPGAANACTTYTQTNQPTFTQPVIRLEATDYPVKTEVDEDSGLGRHRVEDHIDLTYDDDIDESNVIEIKPIDDDSPGEDDECMVASPPSIFPIARESVLTGASSTVISTTDLLPSTVDSVALSEITDLTLTGSTTTNVVTYTTSLTHAVTNTSTLTVAGVTQTSTTPSQVAVADLSHTVAPSTTTAATPVTTTVTAGSSDCVQTFASTASITTGTTSSIPFTGDCSINTDDHIDLTLDYDDVVEDLLGRTGHTDISTASIDDIKENFVNPSSSSVSTGDQDNRNNSLHTPPLAVTPPAEAVTETVLDDEDVDDDDVLYVADLEIDENNTLNSESNEPVANQENTSDEQIKEIDSPASEMETNALSPSEAATAETARPTDTEIGTTPNVRDQVDSPSSSEDSQSVSLPVEKTPPARPQCSDTLDDGQKVVRVKKSERRPSETIYEDSVFKVEDDGSVELVIVRYFIRNNVKHVIVPDDEDKESPQEEFADAEPEEAGDKEQGSSTVPQEMAESASGFDTASECSERPSSPAKSSASASSSARSHKKKYKKSKCSFVKSTKRKRKKKTKTPPARAIAVHPAPVEPLPEPEKKRIQGRRVPIDINKLRQAALAREQDMEAVQNDHTFDDTELSGNDNDSASVLQLKVVDVRSEVDQSTLVVPKVEMMDQDVKVEIDTADDPFLSSSEVTYSTVSDGDESISRATIKSSPVARETSERPVVNDLEKNLRLVICLDKLSKTKISEIKRQLHLESVFMKKNTSMSKHLARKSTGKLGVLGDLQCDTDVMAPSVKVAKKYKRRAILSTSESDPESVPTLADKDDAPQSGKNQEATFKTPAKPRDTRKKFANDHIEQDSDVATCSDKRNQRAGLSASESESENILPNVEEMSKNLQRDEETIEQCNKDSMNSMMTERMKSVRLITEDNHSSKQEKERKEIQEDKERVEMAQKDTKVSKVPETQGAKKADTESTQNHENKKITRKSQSGKDKRKQAHKKLSAIKTLKQKKATNASGSSKNDATKSKCETSKPAKAKDRSKSQDDSESDVISTDTSASYIKKSDHLRKKKKQISEENHSSSKPAKAKDRRKSQDDSESDVFSTDTSASNIKKSDHLRKKKKGISEENHPATTVTTDENFHDKKHDKRKVQKTVLCDQTTETSSDEEKSLQQTVKKPKKVTPIKRKRIIVSSDSESRDDHDKEEYMIKKSKNKVLCRTNETRAKQKKEAPMLEEKRTAKKVYPKEKLNLRPGAKIPPVGKSSKLQPQISRGIPESDSDSDTPDFTDIEKDDESLPSPPAKFSSHEATSSTSKVSDPHQRDLPHKTLKSPEHPLLSQPSQPVMKGVPDKMKKSKANKLSSKLEEYRQKCEAQQPQLKLFKPQKQNNNCDVKGTVERLRKESDGESSKSEDPMQKAIEIYKRNPSKPEKITSRKHSPGEREREHPYRRQYSQDGDKLSHLLHDMMKQEVKDRNKKVDKPILRKIQRRSSDGHSSTSSTSKETQLSASPAPIEERSVTGSTSGKQAPASVAIKESYVSPRPSTDKPTDVSMASDHTRDKIKNAVPKTSSIERAKSENSSTKSNPSKDETKKYSGRTGKDVKFTLNKVEQAVSRKSMDEKEKVKINVSNTEPAQSLNRRDTSEDNASRSEAHVNDTVQAEPVELNEDMGAGATSGSDDDAMEMSTSEDQTPLYPPEDQDINDLYKTRQQLIQTIAQYKEENFSTQDREENLSETDSSHSGKKQKTRQNRRSSESNATRSEDNCDNNKHGKKRHLEGPEYFTNSEVFQQMMKRKRKEKLETSKDLYNGYEGAASNSEATPEVWMTKLNVMANAGAFNDEDVSLAQSILASVRSAEMFNQPEPPSPESSQCVISDRPPPNEVNLQRITEPERPRRTMQTVQLATSEQLSKPQQRPPRFSSTPTTSSAAFFTNVNSYPDWVMKPPPTQRRDHPMYRPKHSEELCDYLKQESQNINHCLNDCKFRIQELKKFIEIKQMDETKEGKNEHMRLTALEIQYLILLDKLNIDKEIVEKELCACTGDPAVLKLTRLPSDILLKRELRQETTAGGTPLYSLQVITKNIYKELQDLKLDMIMARSAMERCPEDKVKGETLRERLKWLNDAREKRLAALCTCDPNDFQVVIRDIQYKTKHYRRMLEEFRKSASENAERITYLAERIEELDSILQCLRGQHESFERRRHSDPRSPNQNSRSPHHGRSPSHSSPCPKGHSSAHDSKWKLHQVEQHKPSYKEKAKELLLKNPEKKYSIERIITLKGRAPMAYAVNYDMARDPRLFGTKPAPRQTTEFPLDQTPEIPHEVVSGPERRRSDVRSTSNTGVGIAESDASSSTAVAGGCDPTNSASGNMCSRESEEIPPESNCTDVQHASPQRNAVVAVNNAEEAVAGAEATALQSQQETQMEVDHNTMCVDLDKNRTDENSVSDTAVGSHVSPNQGNSCVMDDVELLSEITKLIGDVKSEVQDTEAESLDDQTTNVFDTPATQLFKVPETRPHNIQETQPFDLPETQPFDFPETQPFDFSETQPFDIDDTEENEASAITHRQSDINETPPFDVYETQPFDTSFEVLDEVGETEDMSKDDEKELDNNKANESPKEENEMASSSQLEAQPCSSKNKIEKENTKAYQSSTTANFVNSTDTSTEVKETETKPEISSADVKRPTDKILSNKTSDKTGTAAGNATDCVTEQNVSAKASERPVKQTFPGKKCVSPSLKGRRGASKAASRRSNTPDDRSREKRNSSDTDRMGSQSRERSAYREGSQRATSPDFGIAGQVRGGPAPLMNWQPEQAPPWQRRNRYQQAPPWTQGARNYRDDRVTWEGGWDQCEDEWAADTWDTDDSYGNDRYYDYYQDGNYYGNAPRRRGRGYNDGGNMWHRGGYRQNYY